jgi:hypothetical protein
MSNAEYLRGFEEGARAALQGRIRESLMRYWFDKKGFVLPPGGTEMRCLTMEEWQVFVDELYQRTTGHNRLGEPW